MKIHPLLWVASMVLLTSFIKKEKENERAFIRENLTTADIQLKAMLGEMKTSGRYPRTTDSLGKLVTTDIYDWTPGFFPGSLWYAYEFSKDPAMEKAAIQWTEQLEPLKDFTAHHDLGFMMYCSYGNGYRLTGNETYKNNLVQAARSLCTRFNPNVGCIKSWNVFRSWHDSTVYNFPVIIDNMMNLELLFFATHITGDSSFYKVAITHANTTLEHQIRKDYSSFHVICYDSATGKVLAKETAQGYADNSTWARGQAWSIYGYTMTYRETKDPKYLKAAIGLADWYLNNKNLPKDKIPYWDMNVNEKGYTPGARSYTSHVHTKYRDVSAAAIVTSALFELSTYAGNKGTQYKTAAIQMLHALGSRAYKAAPGTNGNFLLKHSVGSIPHKTEIDVPLVYADYYFLEALHRYDLLLQGKKLYN